MSTGLLIYTLVHVAISLLGIGSGFVVIYGIFGNRLLDGWTKFFLATTILTSVTGFGFPITKFTPAHAFGIISLLLLAITLCALYKKRLSGAWRWIYIVTAVVAQYLNFVVLIVQSFQKVAPLQALAPTQSESPFMIAQLAALALFVVIGILAFARFRPMSTARN
jgi:hypothetical protein